MGRVVRACFALFLLACLTVPVRADGDTTPIWRDRERLMPLFEQAVDAVEAQRGVPFETRPTLRLSTRDQLQAILTRELRPQLAATGQEAALETSAAFTARALIAKYEFDTHVIHLLPERFEDEDLPLLGGAEPSLDFFRVLFAHEAAHAHDIPRYGWGEKLGKVESADALKALDALMEGHAQFVAKRVAAAWGIPEAFDTLTSAILEMPEVEQEILRMVLEVLHAELTFSYVRGHAFVEAVHAAKGDAGLEAMLREPPRSTRWIEHPEQALDPDATGPSVDLVRALDAFAALAGDPRWSTVKNRVKESTLEVLRPQVPEAMREDFLRGLVDGHVLVGQIPAEQRQVVVMLLAFEEASQALRFLEIERAVQEARDEAELPDGTAILEARYEEGAGSEGRLAGFRADKRISIGPLELDVASHSFATERFFGQVLRVNVPEITREHEVKAIARLLHYLENPEGAERTHAFDVVPIPLDAEQPSMAPEAEPAGSAR